MPPKKELNHETFVSRLCLSQRLGVQPLGPCRVVHPARGVFPSCGRRTDRVTWIGGNLLWAIGKGWSSSPEDDAGLGRRPQTGRTQGVHAGRNGSHKRAQYSAYRGGCLRARLSGTSRVQPLLGDRSVNSLGSRKRPQSTSKWLGRSLYNALRPLWFALQSRPEAKRLFF